MVLVYKCLIVANNFGNACLYIVFTLNNLCLFIPSSLSQLLLSVHGLEYCVFCDVKQTYNLNVMSCFIGHFST